MSEGVAWAQQGPSPPAQRPLLLLTLRLGKLRLVFFFLISYLFLAVLGLPRCSSSLWLWPVGVAPCCDVRASHCRGSSCGTGSRVLAL